MSDKTKILKVRCPGCQQMAIWADNPYRPFCSEMCKSKDLGNWATGRYRIAGDPVGTGPDGITEKDSKKEEEEP